VKSACRKMACGGRWADGQLQKSALGGRNGGIPGHQPAKSISSVARLPWWRGENCRPARQPRFWQTANPDYLPDPRHLPVKSPWLQRLIASQHSWCRGRPSQIEPHRERIIRKQQIAW